MKPRSFLNGRRVLGSIYSGPSRHQDLRYKARCDKLMAERVAKQAQQTKARADG